MKLSKPGEPLKGKYMIPRTYLHPEVEKTVAQLISMRDFRTGMAITFPLIGSNVPLISPDLGLFLVPETLAATGAAVGYAIGSGPVSEQTKKVGEAVSKHGFLAESVPDRFKKMATLIQMKKTHPAFYVDIKGNIVLVPKSRIEKAIQKLGIGRRRTEY